jgi:anti-sigma factor RsiW
MSSCASIDPLVTPYVDGELGEKDREALERHLRACPPCRTRVDHERAVHELVTDRRRQLTSSRASSALHARCAGACTASAAVAGAAPAWRPRAVPLALAATLVVVVAGAFAYPLTMRSSRLMAAELAVDHMKCALFNNVLGTQHAPSLVESSLAADFGWPARLPEDPGRAGLELIGERTCLYGGGRVAHLMYRHGGRAVSVFMLPNDDRKDEVVSVLGHQAVVWSVGNRAFVLVAREPIEEAERMASFVRASLR